MGGHMCWEFRSLTAWRKTLCSSITVLVRTVLNLLPGCMWENRLWEGMGEVADDIWGSTDAALVVVQIQQRRQWGTSDPLIPSAVLTILFSWFLSPCYCQTRRRCHMLVGFRRHLGKKVFKAGVGRFALLIPRRDCHVLRKQHFHKLGAFYPLDVRATDGRWSMLTTVNGQPPLLVLLKVEN